MCESDWTLAELGNAVYMNICVDMSNHVYVYVYTMYTERNSWIGRILLYRLFPICVAHKNQSTLRSLLVKTMLLKLGAVKSGIIIGQEKTLNNSESTWKNAAKGAFVLGILRAKRCGIAANGVYSRWLFYAKRRNVGCARFGVKLK